MQSNSGIDVWTAGRVRFAMSLSATFVCLFWEDDRRDSFPPSVAIRLGEIVCIHCLSRNWLWAVSYARDCLCCRSFKDSSCLHLKRPLCIKGRSTCPSTCFWTSVVMASQVWQVQQHKSWAEVYTAFTSAAGKGLRDDRSSSTNTTRNGWHHLQILGWRSILPLLFMTLYIFYDSTIQLGWSPISHIQELQVLLNRQLRLLRLAEHGTPRRQFLR